MTQTRRAPVPRSQSARKAALPPTKLHLPSRDAVFEPLHPPQLQGRCAVRVIRTQGIRLRVPGSAIFILIFLYVPFSRVRLYLYTSFVVAVVFSTSEPFVESFIEQHT